MKQFTNVMKSEGQFDKDRGTLNFKALSKKVTVRPSNDGQKEKKDLHVIRKDHFKGLRGPGQYPVAQKNTSFNVPIKDEQQQCFNSTAMRFPEHAV